MLHAAACTAQALAPGGLAAQDVHRPLPHVSECNYCQKCAITPPSGASSGEASLLDGGKPGGGRAQWRRLQRGQQQHQQRLLATPAAKSRRGLLLEPERAVAMPGDADGSGHGAPMAVDQKPNTGSEQQQQQQQSAVPEGGNGSIGTSYASDRLDEDGIEDAKRAWEAIRGPLAARYAMAALAAGVPGEVISDPHFLLPELLEQPADVQEKQLKPNCTRCYGCTARLYGMQSPEAAAEAAAEEAEAGVGGKGEGAIGGVGEAADVGSLPKPQYTLGGTPTWQFFARTPASQRRMVVKVRGEVAGWVGLAPCRDACSAAVPQLGPAQTTSMCPVDYLRNANHKPNVPVPLGVGITCTLGLSAPQEAPRPLDLPIAPGPLPHTPAAGVLHAVPQGDGAAHGPLRQRHARRARAAGGGAGPAGGRVRHGRPRAAVSRGLGGGVADTPGAVCACRACGRKQAHEHAHCCCHVVYGSTARIVLLVRAQDIA